MFLASEMLWELVSPKMGLDSTSNTAYFFQIYLWSCFYLTSSDVQNKKIDRETVETVVDFILGGSKITADGDCSHEI